MPLLVDVFIQKYSQTNTSLQKKTPNPLAASGVKAILQAAQTSEKVYFAQSTMLMLADTLRHYEEVIAEVETLLHNASAAPVKEALQGRMQAFTSAWIEFDKPIKFPREIAAMLCFRPEHFIDSGKHTYLLNLIDPSGNVVYVLEADDGMEWSFLPQFHTCQQCTKEYGVLLLCDTCKSILLIWSQILALAMIIAGQYLAAMRYEEATFSGVRRIPRQQNVKKEKKQHVSYQFKVIDANEILIRLPTPAEQSHLQGPLGASWVESAQEQDNLIYIETHTRPFKRTYRADRYAASGLLGTSIQFPEGIIRQQPRRKDLVGKQVKKVKASRYEQEAQIGEHNGQATADS